MNFLSLACALLLAAGADRVQHLPEGWQRINALAIDPRDPRTLYLDVLTEERGGGLFRSADGGRTWKALPKTAAGPGSTVIADETGMLVLALAISPLDSNTLFAGTYAGAFKSTDGGKSWTPSLLGKAAQPKEGSSHLKVSALRFDPANPKAVYAGTEAGVFRSTDEGSHWTLLPAGPVKDEFGMEDPDIQAGDLVFDPSRPGNFFALTQGGILKTGDAGSSWRQIDKDLGIEDEFITAQALAIDPRSPRVLLIGNDEGLFKSTNDGETWSHLSEAVTGPFRALVFDPSQAGVVYAGRSGDLLRSDDGGQTWARIRTNGVTALILDPQAPATIYAGTEEGLFKSMNRGETWAPAGSGLPGSPQGAPGPPQAATDDAIVRKVFGPAVQIQRPLSPLIFYGDFNGDGESDLLAIVTLDSKVGIPKDVTILEPWGKPELPAPERPRALVIVHRKGDQILGRFVLLGEVPNSWKPDYSGDLDVEVVNQGEGKEALPDVTLRGDVIRTPARVWGDDIFLYWDGQTYKTFAPEEEP